MATIERTPRAKLYGIVFDLDESERPQLDRAEGLGKGYNREDAFLVQMEGSGETVRAFTYIADPAHQDDTLKPYEWYLQLVLVGARQNGLPADYVNSVEGTQAVPDPQPHRRERLNALAVLRRCEFDV